MQDLHRRKIGREVVDQEDRGWPGPSRRRSSMALMTSGSVDVAVRQWKRGLRSRWRSPRSGGWAEGRWKTGRCGPAPGRSPQASSAPSQPGSKVCMAPTMIGTPVSAETAEIPAASSPLMANGFSQSTAFLPARQLAMTCAAWNWCGLQMATMSTAGSARSSSMLVLNFAPTLTGHLLLRPAGSTSMMWRTSRRLPNRARDGRWMAWVTGPAPRMPTPTTSR